MALICSSEISEALWSSACYSFSSLVIPSPNVNGCFFLSYFSFSNSFYCFASSIVFWIISLFDNSCLSYSARFWFWVEEAIDYDLDFNIVKGYTYIDWLGIEIWFTKVIFSDYKLSKEFPSISCMWLSAFVMLSCSLG